MLLLRLCAMAAMVGIVCSLRTSAQVYSPVVVKKGQPDATDLKAFAQAIYADAGAHTSREKAEAIWRFFLTDGRFVKPGFWYHIAGWAYEEPMGEVLDPMKLLNSYGFGLCYHLAPLLEAVYKSGGFEDARVWFLTGHNVAEVFYDGRYHYFDSDMMGYNTVGTGPVARAPVASVHEIEQNGSIIVGKLQGPKQVRTGVASQPWYPADVRAGAIGDLAGLFTTTADNRVYPFTRYPNGHSMHFTLRPGERMVRYYRPEQTDVRYLPYKFDGTRWSEFPQEIAQYKIRTADGPRSQKDDRMWATGRIEYRPEPAASQGDSGAVLLFDMPCPYVTIDAQFTMNVRLLSETEKLQVETSVDGGHSWQPGSSISGPSSRSWTADPAVLVTSEHGRKTAVTGSYGYRVRIRLTGTNAPAASRVSNLLLTTRFQLNPRTLPELVPGKNELEYHAAKEERFEMPVDGTRLNDYDAIVKHAEYISEAGQGYYVNTGSDLASIVLPVQTADKRAFTGFDAGGRFLDLQSGFAPDKLTAEVRKITPWPQIAEGTPTAEISWSLHPEGPFTTLWTYDSKLKWKDGVAIDRTLLWPEVDLHLRELPPHTKQVYVRYSFRGMAIDDFRLAAVRAAAKSSPLNIIHVWNENGTERRYVQRVAESERPLSYAIDIPENTLVENRAVVYECPAGQR
jgi:hypothetical protein